MIGSGGADVSATVKGLRASHEAEPQGQSLGEVRIGTDLVDALARHADCTSQRGLIAVKKAQGVRLTDREVCFHG